MTQAENSPLTAHDPEHDVDGIKTSVAVFGSLLLIVVTIWATSHLFSLMVQVESITTKYHTLPQGHILIG